MVGSSLGGRHASNRVALLDAVRVVAVGLVVAAHVFQRAGSSYGNRFGVSDFFMVSIGGVGVVVLIVLSGMVTRITYGGEGLSWGRFMRRRLAHIYPTFWIALGVALLMAGSSTLLKRWPSLLFEATGMWTFTGVDWARFLIAADWFITLIIVLYALYPWLATCMRRFPNTTLIVAFAVSVASRIICGRIWPEAYYPTRVNDWMPLSRVFEYVLGMWLVATPAKLAWVRNLPRPPSAVSRWLSWASAVSFAVFLVHLPIIAFWMPPGAVRLRYVALFAAATLATAEMVRLAAEPLERWMRGGKFVHEEQPQSHLDVVPDPAEAEV